MIAREMTLTLGYWGTYVAWEPENSKFDVLALY